MYCPVDSYREITYKIGVCLLATKTFGEQLREWRQAARLTQVALAEALGVEQQTVSDYERDRARPHGSRVVDIERALNLPPQTALLALYASDEANMEAGITQGIPAERDQAPDFSGRTWDQLEPSEQEAIRRVAQEFLSRRRS